MRFINSTPTGRDDPRLRGGGSLIYHQDIKVKVFDQDDVLAGGDWRFGDLGVPRWEHTFTARGSAVYKPSSGTRYSAVITARWQEESAQNNSWIKGASGKSREFIQHLGDDGQWIDIRPEFGAPREIDLVAGMDGSGPSLFAGPGVLYLVNNEGALLYYHHDATGHFDVDQRAIGSGWRALKAFAVRSGGVYTIAGDGKLRYYHHNESGTWDDVNGRAIGHGWGGFAWVGAGRLGQIYAISSDHDLLYYEHDADFRWLVTGKKIGSGWPHSKVFAGGSNCLYLVDSGGDLLYYYHNDAHGWVHQSLKIGTGWSGFSTLSSSGNGEIYGVAGDGTLRFYRHDVDKRWIPGSGRTIGSGWGSHGFQGILASAR